MGFLKRNKSYCVMPFSEIYADSAGRYKLCCHAGKMDELKKYNTSTHNPFDFFLSKEMDEVRNKMLSGIKIPECQICYDQEKHGKSFRTGKYNDRYNIVTEPIEIGLKLRVNGSFCNLSCYMCHPYNSSTKRNEMKETFGTQLVKGFYNDSNQYKAVKHDRWNSIIDDILKHIHLIKHIHLTGGEPLQLPKHWEMIDKIPKEHAKNIGLAYDTNLTELRYKNHSVYDVIDKFKRVYYGISCDHYQEKLSWIRYPIDVKQFEKNLKEMLDSGFNANISCTISLLNVFDLIDINNYYKNKFGANVHFNSIVTTPNFLSIRHLPLDVKQKLLRQLDVPVYDRRGVSKFQLVKTQLKLDGDTTNLQKAYDYMDKLSKNRNFDWRKLWPDFLK